MKTRNGALLIALAFAFGCGGGESAKQETTETPEAAPAAPAAPAAATAEAPSGPIDEALAEQGKQLFTTRGCTGCHQIDTKLIGPPLKGVTNQRSYAWITNMILHPDSMTANDPAAKALLAEYGAQMVNMGATADDVRALYEYLRQQSQ
jgi:cytochrome c